MDRSGNRCVLGFIGPSGAGKTTLIESLLRVWTQGGRAVSAIKHTHHHLNEERRGDTERFLRAGASESILCDEREAVLFTPGATRRFSYGMPTDLLQQVTSDHIVVEGFKRVSDWPQLVVARDESSLIGIDLGRVSAIVFRDPGSVRGRFEVPLFGAHELAALGSFLDTICSS